MRFDGLDDIAQLLARHHQATRYVHLAQRTGSGQGETSVSTGARFDVEPGDVPEGEAPPPTNGTPPPWVTTCLSWLRTRAQRIATTPGATKFQVLLNSEGSKYVASGMFVAHREDDDDVPLDKLLDGLGTAEARAGGTGTGERIDPAMFPKVDEIEGASLLQTLELTGAHGAFLFRLVMPTVTVLMKQALGANERLASVSEQQRRVINALQADNQRLRDEARLAGNAAASDREDRVNRRKMVNKVVGEVTAFGRTYMTLQAGLPAELAPLMESILGDPGLRKELANPDLHALMKDADERKALADMLRAVSAIYRQRKETEKEEKEKTDGAKGAGSGPAANAPDLK